MTETISNLPTGNCHHYPNRILRKRHLADELEVCERTVDNLVDNGKLPQPCWLNSIPVWMLYDIHAFISAAAGSPRAASNEAAPSEKETASKDDKKAKGSAHKAGKFSV